MTQMPMTLITAICYVRFSVPELSAAARFAGDVFGLQSVPAGDGEVAFRSDNRFRTVSFSSDASEGVSIGVEVWSEAALDEIERALRQQEFTVARATPEACRARHVQMALLARDGSGNAIDLVLRPAQSGRRYFPTRDAGITGFHGIGVRSTHLARDQQFWKAIGAQVRDWVGDIAYLQIDGHHHRVALYPSQRNGLLYAAFEVESLDNVMQNSYFMQESQVRIIQGPGREPASEQMFLHVEGPAGIIFSYVSGMAQPGAMRRPPRQFPLTLESLCSWGSESKDVAELRAT
jgi:2,3-dihydroxy-p-cumate/2,3-dihydroxybenzoate 3,4-dioxygenase